MFLNFFEKKVFLLEFDVAELNGQPWFKEIGQWLENVDQTHLVLYSCSLVPQKTNLHKLD